jgi:hypothetical protein
LFIAGFLEELGTQLANRINGFGLNQPHLSLVFVPSVNSRYGSL